MFKYQLTATTAWGEEGAGPIPSEFMLMVPYLVTVVAVTGFVGRVRAPAADGTPYKRGESH